MKNEKTLMYGDRVRFYWKDEYFENNTDLVCDWEGQLEGLYGGVCGHNDKLAVVTVTTEGPFRGHVLHPWMCNLEWIEHPAIFRKKEEKDDTRPYDLEALYEMRDNIMDNFDFNKIAQVMEFLDWGWAFVATGDGYETSVPTEPEIRKFARSMMTELIEKLGTEDSTSSIDSGGFRVDFDDYDGTPNLRLSFNVDEWDEGCECWDEYQRNIDRRKETGRFKPLKK